MLALAGLHLAIAEIRAATDALTGLPNNRAVRGAPSSALFISPARSARTPA
jgi:GGDEF domain-containing protein